MSILSLRQIQKSVEDMALLIGVPSDYLPSFGKPVHDAHPYIDSDSKEYHYVVQERGHESERRSTTNLDELFYWIFKSITWSMAVEFELSNRIVAQDCRRIIFRKQGDLLRTLSQIWQQRFSSETEQLLQQHPFDDLAALRASYCRRLRRAGVAENTIEKMAYRKYPGVLP